MREIKFRAWDRKNGVMAEVMNLTFRANEVECVHYANGGGVYMFNGESEIDRYALMQFTGLKDKNKKEIYFDDYVIDENFSANIFIVKWNKTKISLLNISNGDIINIGDIKNLIIKSNIYENAFELITKYREIS